MNKEEIYDEHISPLMTEIIALCKEHKINMFATFCIPTEDDDGLRCTTSLPVDDGDKLGHDNVCDLTKLALKRPDFVALTITTGQT